MLLIIAIANTSYWLPQGLPETQAETFVSLFRSLVVDQRGYPLFALLLGFGIGVLASRYCQRDGESAARHKIMHRGLWLLAFGAVHALLFPAEILGTYGVATMLLSFFVFSSVRTKAVIAAVSMTASTAVLLALGAYTQSPGSTVEAPRFDAVENLAMWLVTTVFTLVASMTIPMMLLGMALSQSQLMRSPERFRGVLGALIAAGTLLAVGGLPHALSRAGVAEEAMWHQWLHVLSGVGVATAILFAIVWLCSFKPRGLRVFEIAGQHSLTGYLLQSLLFAAAVLMIGSEVSAVMSVVIAVGGWIIMLTVCTVLSSTSGSRPFERALRRATSLSAERLSASKTGGLV